MIGMFYEVFAHEYFWLSFLPISFLCIGFWLLFFDRVRGTQDPFYLLIMAVGAGFIATLVFSLFEEVLKFSHFSVLVFWEEFAKVVMAIVAMEIFKNRFKSVAEGIVYGFAVGLGFSFAENLVYLARAYEMADFTANFWLTFQGRFWSSILLHGVTTAFFGLYYSAAYLAETVAKKDHESPLRVFFVPPSFKQLWEILTLHVTREHLIFNERPTLNGHYARAVILEGFLIAYLIHFFFNLALIYSFPGAAFFIALGFMFWLRKEVEEVSPKQC